MTDLALPHPASPRPSGRVGRWSLLALGAAAIAATAVLLAHATTPAYGVPGWGIAVTAGLLAAVLIGARLVWTTGRFGFAARVAIGVAVVVLGVLSLASIGLPVVLLGVLLLAGVARRREGGKALAGATLMGAALPVLVLLALAGPVVSCSANGVSTGENAFMALGSGGTRLSGDMSSAPSGTTAGQASGPGYAYSYVCRGDRLERFDLRWR